MAEHNGSLIYTGGDDHRANMRREGFVSALGRDVPTAFVHAPSSGGTVRLDQLDGPYWRQHYTGAKRVLR